MQSVSNVLTIPTCLVPCSNQWSRHLPLVGSTSSIGSTIRRPPDCKSSSSIVVHCMNFGGKRGDFPRRTGVQQTVPIANVFRPATRSQSQTCSFPWVLSRFLFNKATNSVSVTIHIRSGGSEMICRLLCSFLVPIEGELAWKVHLKVYTSRVAAEHRDQAHILSYLKSTLAVLAIFVCMSYYLNKAPADAEHSEKPYILFSRKENLHSPFLATWIFMSCKTCIYNNK